MNDLPVAERWFRVERVTDEVVLLVEDHLDPFFESNVWRVRGREHDLVVDTGNGIGDLRAELEPFAGDRPIVAVAPPITTSTTSAGCTRSTSGGATRPM